MRIPQLIAQNKPVFGTYATMALKNVQIVLDHIQKIESLQDQMPERGPEDFWVHPVMQFFYSERYATNVDPEKADAIKERLFRNFPFLKIWPKISVITDVIRIIKEKEDIGIIILIVPILR